MRPSVLFVGEAGESTSAHYRCAIPAYGLRQLGWDTYRASVVCADENGRIRAVTGNGGLLTASDVVVCRRMLNHEGKQLSNAGMFRNARKAGQRVFVDLDDDPWNIPEWNPAHGTANVTRWAKDMEAATGVIVSTPVLAESVRQHLRKSAVFVCRSGIATEGIPPAKYDESPPIRLGWLGMLSFRRRDIEMILPAIEKIQAETGFEFWHLGSQPLQDGERLSKYSQPWMPLETLYSSLANTIDVAVVPMFDHPVNRARSNTTALALMAAGIPFVASDCNPEYEDLWRHGAGYVVPNDTEEWTRAIRLLVSPEYSQYRSDMRTAGLQLVRHYSPERMAEQYVKAFHAD